MDLDLQGRTAKAYIDKWAQYTEKTAQMGTSAAIVLIEVKEELNSHQKYGRWMEKYGIHPRQSSRLILEYRHPEKAVERKEKQKKADVKAKDMRAQAADMHVRESTDKPLETNETPKTGEDEHPVVLRQEVMGYLKTATDAEILRLHTFIYGEKA